MTSIAPARLRSLVRWLPAGLLVAALVIHVPTFDQPLLERHPFRQTQTAFTARVFHEQGIDLLHAKLPVLGPPWEVPFEFPLFQAAAAVVIDVGVAEDPALRLTGFATFLLAAVLLWRLVRRQVGELGGIIALGVFLFSPLAIEWSRAALIEYLALAASIGFALAGLRWRDRLKGRWYVLGLLLGSVAALVKFTTAGAWLLPFALLGFTRDRATETRRTTAAAWILSIAPILVGLAWTRWADAIKSASAATDWLTSTALLHWTVGDVPQRLDPAAWERTGFSVIILAGGISLPLLAIPIVRFAQAHDQRRFWTWITLTLVGPVVLFFNLYFQHDYYAIAVSASVAALVGVGFAEIVRMRSTLARLVVPLAVAITIVAWFAFVPYWTRIYDRVSDPEGVLPLAAQIKRETEPGQYVAIIGRDWTPSVLYYADRWGWMVRDADWPPGLLSRLLDEGWAVYRCPALNERDHCDRITTAAQVPVDRQTFSPVFAISGLVQSGP
jgi:hypothetical protein